jgi:hypothetical protein
MTKKKLYTIIGISVGGALLIAGVITAIVLLRKPPTQGDSRIIDEDALNKIKAKYPQKNAEFPLKKGSKGLNVINVNIALGLAPSDVFSTNTESELFKRFNVKQVTESDYEYYKNLFKK